MRGLSRPVAGRYESVSDRLGCPRGQLVVVDMPVGSASLDLLHYSPVPMMLCHKRSDGR